MNNKLTNIANSLLTLICLISLFGGLVYGFYSLNKWGVAISLTLAIISFIIIHCLYFYANKKNRRQPEVKSLKPKFRTINLFFIISYLLLLAVSFSVLFGHQTANAIISPWQIVPGYFFIIYGLTTFVLMANVIMNGRLALPLIMAHYFLSLAVALIVYRLGYGYDSFVHRATENLIAQIGAVSPKPFYYLGQYSLVVILHKITALPVILLDKLLVPFLAAIYLPLILWQALKAWFNDERLNLILILSLLVFTFPFLIVTTPQNLAYLFLLMVIFLGLICANFYDFLVILLLASTALVIQPIAGLPALLFCAFLAVYHSDLTRLKKYLYPLLVIITILILPAAFYFLNQRLTSAAVSDGLLQNLSATTITFPGQENFILNFIYFYGFNLKIVLALFVLSGMFIALKYRQQCKIIWLYLTLAAALFASYFITAKMPFAFLINYERSDYAARILLIASFFLLPFVLLAIYGLLEKILARNLVFKISWAVFLTLSISAAVYLSYPRFDNYFNSRGLSVSASDIKAVNWINENSKNDFIVLANQQVSAAALNQFGFKKYYDNGQLFYYPIPTSSPLYQFYLNMVYKTPSRETMFRAMNLAGVKEGYFVLNKYWWGFKKILDQAKLSADSFKEIDQGEVFVFKYDRD